MLTEAALSRRLVFGAGVILTLLVAIFFRSFADTIAKRTRISHAWALAIAIVLVAVFFVLISTLFGTTISQNVSTLIEQLPTAWRDIRGRIGEVRWLVDALDRAGQALLTSNVMSRIGGALGTVMGVLTNIFLVLFAGLYIAAQPKLYRDGFLKLVPPQDRPRIDATLVRCGVFLRNWLLGQLIAMIVVGTPHRGGPPAASGSLRAGAGPIRRIGGVHPDSWADRRRNSRADHRVFAGLASRALGAGDVRDHSTA